MVKQEFGAPKPGTPADTSLVKEVSGLDSEIKSNYLKEIKEKKEDIRNNLDQLLAVLVPLFAGKKTEEELINKIKTSRLNVGLLEELGRDEDKIATEARFKEGLGDLNQLQPLIVDTLANLNKVLENTDQEFIDKNLVRIFTMSTSLGHMGLNNLLEKFKKEKENPVKESPKKASKKEASKEKSGLDSDIKEVYLKEIKKTKENITNELDKVALVLVSLFEGKKTEEEIILEIKNSDLNKAQWEEFGNDENKIETEEKFIKHLEALDHLEELVEETSYKLNKIYDKVGQGFIDENLDKLYELTVNLDYKGFADVLRNSIEYKNQKNLTEIKSFAERLSSLAEQAEEILVKVEDLTEEEKNKIQVGLDYLTNSKDVILGVQGRIAKGLEKRVINEEDVSETLESIKEHGPYLDKMGEFFDAFYDISEEEYKVEESPEDDNVEESPEENKFYGVAKDAGIIPGKEKNSPSSNNDHKEGSDKDKVLKSMFEEVPAGDKETESKIELKPGDKEKIEYTLDKINTKVELYNDLVDEIPSGEDREEFDQMLENLNMMSLYFGKAEKGKRLEHLPVRLVESVTLLEESRLLYEKMLEKYFKPVYNNIKVPEESKLRNNSDDFETLLDLFGTEDEEDEEGSGYVESDYEDKLPPKQISSLQGEEVTVEQVMKVMEENKLQKGQVEPAKESNLQDTLPPPPPKQETSDQLPYEFGGPAGQTEPSPEGDVTQGEDTVIGKGLTPDQVKDREKFHKQAYEAAVPVDQKKSWWDKLMNAFSAEETEEEESRKYKKYVSKKADEDLKRQQGVKTWRNNFWGKLKDWIVKE